MAFMVYVGILVALFTVRSKVVFYKTNRRQDSGQFRTNMFYVIGLYTIFFPLIVPVF